MIEPLKIVQNKCFLESQWYKGRRPLKILEEQQRKTKRKKCEAGEKGGERGRDPGG